MSRAHDSVLFNGTANAGFTATQGPFELKGGKYAVAALGTSAGNTISLEHLGPDGTTYQAVGTSTTFAADAEVVVDLAPGLYKFAVSGTITAGYAQAVRIPND